MRGLATKPWIIGRRYKECGQRQIRDLEPHREPGKECQRLSVLKFVLDKKKRTNRSNHALPERMHRRALVSVVARHPFD